MRRLANTIPIGKPIVNVFGTIPGGTVLFMDDFNGTAGQTLGNPARPITIPRYKWQGTDNKAVDGAGKLTSVAAFVPNWVAAEVSEMDVELVVRYPDPATEGSQEWIVFNFVDNSNFYFNRLLLVATTGNVNFQTYKRVAGGYTVLANVLDSTLTPGSYIPLRTVVSGANVACFYNNVMYYKATLPTREHQASPKFGLCSDSVATPNITFDSFTLKKVMTGANAPSGTVLFRDDFNDSVAQSIGTAARQITANPLGIGWNIYNIPWSTDGLGSVTKASNNSYSWVDVGTSNFRVTINHTLPDPNTNSCNSGLVFNYVDNGNYLMLRVFRDGLALPTTTNIVQMFVKSSGTYTQLGNYVIVETPGVYQLRADVQGATIKWFYNGSQKQTYNYPERPHRTSSGVGLYGESNNAAVAATALNVIDEFEVTKL